MRKVIALGLLASMVPALAMAAGNHTMGGCGLGYLLLSNLDNDCSGERQQAAPAHPRLLGDGQAWCVSMCHDAAG